MKRDINKLIAQMTLEEKAGLCSGFDTWHTKGIERLGIPAIMMTDGPHGLRKQTGPADHLGVNASVPATCFPSSAALACSWDRQLLEKVGAALGKECQAEKVAILLGPGTNIKRSPLCGRNFEYFSEDPFLSSEMAANHIKGVQSQGVGTSLKHYAVNNQESNRMLIDAMVDERTLREIYLASFEGAVRQSQPWTVMCAYNKVNGTYCSENKYLLTDILKEEWGHQGFVVSDWGAVNDRADGLAAGLELEMPASGGRGDKEIVQAVKDGKLPESILDQAVGRLLAVILKAAGNMQPDASYDQEAHHNLARKAAGECAVLLKNEGNILPLEKKGTLAVIGAFARHPRYQGGGSSHVNPTRLDSALEEIKKTAGDRVKVLYAPGYRLDEEAGMFGGTPFQSISDNADNDLINEARSIAASADTAVVFTGLPDNYESEGFDRKHMRIPEGHLKLIEAVADVQPNLLIVLSNGSPIEMPWLHRARGVLEVYLGGQAFGGAAADLLFGAVNPCGKLAETFPKKLQDNPSYLFFPGDGRQVEYREGLYVGYRYYDAAEAEPLFPFGFGLSYTQFEYTDISVDKSRISDSETVTVSVKIKNTGRMAGKEIVQLYVRDMDSTVVRPRKELKGFAKAEIQPGEEKTVTFTLGKRAFAYYHTGLKDWHAESGDFEIMAGASSQDIRLKKIVFVESSDVIKKIFTKNSSVGEIISHPRGAEYLRKNLLKDSAALSGSTNAGFHNFVKDMPLRSAAMFNPAVFTNEKIEELLQILNCD